MIKSILAILMLTVSVPAGASIDGPFNGFFIPSGNGLKKPLSNSGTHSWTISTWVDWNGPQTATVVIGGFGPPTADHRYLAIVDGKLGFVTGTSEAITSEAVVTPHHVSQVVASYDGSKLTLYLDKKAVSERPLTLAAVAAEMHLAPYSPDTTHFAGRLALFQIASGVVLPSGVAPDMRLINFEAGSESWPFQTRAQAGYRTPQAPSTLPTSGAEFSKPSIKPPYSGPVLRPRHDGETEITGGWRLIAEPDVAANVDQLSIAGFDVSKWYQATVPGTVLTTLIDRGVYPDPDYGLNNMAIPESLNRQDYWYRTEFNGQNFASDDRVTLTFNGINYLAKVWLNGRMLGQIKGAFIRGVFDVTGVIKANEANVLLVRISPPPHSGIPQEQSVKGGPGENGGSMCLDGPTFVATEGWDWIPAVRDRNTGIWQNVTIKASKALSIGDAQVVTTLPLPDTSRATVKIRVPLHNGSDQVITTDLHADFEGASLVQSVSAKPGDSYVTFSEEVKAPRLWWPNGYGRQELYNLRLWLTSSDVKYTRFGIRDISYELSLMDQTGNLQRVEVDPAHAADSKPIVDIRHEAIIRSNRGWVYSLSAEGQKSAAVKPLTDTQLTPFLVIRVNGVRIAARGGSWGMDDSRKRVSREHLEPFFKLHHDANLNIIRNWVGQSTEETFFDLADEYGLLVFNDFWQSTQNYNVEPTDTALFLDNARDTIQRFRNHPSIVLWCGRNEGVPAPALNEALDALIREADGTRIYLPSSNTINLQDSGPYKYFEPVDYFTKFNKGFSVEVGIPSFPTIDSFQAFTPKSEEWPINDTWAYHDWHQSGNGVMEPFMSALAASYGAPKGLQDFERKAQLMNYVSHRAIFEGMNAKLWTANSGRMLWMTQPAWPSTVWQILSSDYDTHASFYGVKKASEQVHIQMNLPDLRVAVINNTTFGLHRTTARARVFDLTGKLLATDEKSFDADPVAVTQTFELKKSVPASGLVFVKLQLLDAGGEELSQNFYWYANQTADYQAIGQLAPSELKAALTQNGNLLIVTLENTGTGISFMNKLTLRNSEDGSRVLPAYYSDNYVSLLPGEKRQIRIEHSLGASDRLQVSISGWNQRPVVVSATK